jgi:hypothetical protein
MAITNVIFYEDCLAPHAELLGELPGFISFFAVEPLFRREPAFRHKLHLSVPLMRTALEVCGHIRDETTQRAPGFRMAVLVRFYELVVPVSR